MRWVLAVAALALGAWYFRNQRRGRRGAGDEGAPPDKTPVDLQARVKEMAANASGAAQSVASTATEQARKLAEGAGKTADTMGDSGNASAPSGSAVETDVNTPPPSIRETTRAEMADVDEQVDALRAQSEAPPDPAEKSAGEAFGAGSGASVDPRAAQSPQSEREAETVEGGVEPLNAAGATATTGTPDATGATGQNEATSQGGAQPSAGQGEGSRRASEARANGGSIAPEGQRPRPIAGEGTTTATGGTVNPLSPVTDGDTATGKAEPLPQGLEAGAPGTGGPAGSTQAPTIPDSSETPTTGMEQTPVVDRAAEVSERTSGAYIGNKKTRIFHLATSANLPGEDNRVYFETEEEALAAGFTPAANEGLQGGS